MTLKIEIDTDNAAFEDAIASETGRILRKLARDMERGVLPPIPLIDINRNKVGVAEVIP